MFTRNTHTVRYDTKRFFAVGFCHVKERGICTPVPVYSRPNLSKPTLNCYRHRQQKSP